MSGGKWGEDEIQRLAALYPHEPRWKKLLPMFPGRTKFSIQQKAGDLEIRRAVNSRVAWLPSEKSALRKLWPDGSWPDITAAIPRHSKTAIGRQASTMGLKRIDKATKRSRYQLIREMRALRIASGVSTSFFAQQLGAHRIQISKWERGETVPRLATFFDWVEALGYRIRLERIR